MSIESTLAAVRERSVVIEQLRAQSAAQTEAVQRAVLRQQKKERRRRIFANRRIREQVHVGFTGVQNLCALGRSPEVQELIAFLGPIELWGWHVKQSDWSWDCYIRLELERLAIYEGVSDDTKPGLQIFYDYQITDPVVAAFGKQRLCQIANGHVPFDEESWAMVAHELERTGYVQGSEPVLMQILVECATDEGLKRWFLRGR